MFSSHRTIFKNFIILIAGIKICLKLFFHEFTKRTNFFPKNISSELMNNGHQQILHGKSN